MEQGQFISRAQIGEPIPSEATLRKEQAVGSEDENGIYDDAIRAFVVSLDKLEGNDEDGAPPPTDASDDDDDDLSDQGSDDAPPGFRTNARSLYVRVSQDASDVDAELYVGDRSVKDETQSSSQCKPERGPLPCTPLVRMHIRSCSLRTTATLSISKRCIGSFKSQVGSPMSVSEVLG